MCCSISISDNKSDVTSHASNINVTTNNTGHCHEIHVTREDVDQISCPDAGVSSSSCRLNWAVWSLSEPHIWWQLYHSVSHNQAYSCPKNSQKLHSRRTFLKLRQIQEILAVTWFLNFTFHPDLKIARQKVLRILDWKVLIFYVLDNTFVRPTIMP